MTLSLCPGCSRHVREDVCPFCGAAVARFEGVSLPRVARIALLGAAAAAVATACSSAPAYGGPPDSSNDGNTIDAVPFYGGPPFEAGTDAEADSSGDAGDGSTGD